jgi:RNA polymerase sigma factor (sigma-70 family)
MPTSPAPFSPPDERELGRVMAAAARADDEAWAALYQQFGSRLHAVARRHRLGTHDAEDVAQTTWLQLFTHIDGVREPAKVGAYLHTVARHVCVRRVTRTRYEEPLQDEVLQRPGAESDADAPLIERERADALTAAVLRLPDRQRRLMQMMLAEPAPSYAEISEELDMPVGSIGPTRARCFERLAKDPELAAVAG